MQASRRPLPVVMPNRSSDGEGHFRALHPDGCAHGFRSSTLATLRRHPRWLDPPPTTRSDRVRIGVLFLTGQADSTGRNWLRGERSSESRLRVLHREPPLLVAFQHTGAEQQHVRDACRRQDPQRIRGLSRQNLAEFRVRCHLGR